jgi:hypothetical protein
MKYILAAIYLFFVSHPLSAQPYIAVTSAPYKASCNGTTDDTVAIQSAINAAQSRGVALYIPKTANGCRVTSTLNVTSSIKITGAGTMPYQGAPRGDSSRGPGSWIYFDHNSVGLRISNGLGNPISGVIIADVGTRRKQPSPGTGGAAFTPCNCDYDFKIEDADVELNDVTALNPTKLAYVDNTAAVRFIVNNLRAQPLKEGINIHRAYEVVRLNGVSFWAYWADLQNVNTYTINNRKSLWFFRVDNPQVSNFFSIFDNNCIAFDHASDGSGENGITSRFQGQNIGCDQSVVGVVVAPAAKFTTAQFTNFYVMQPQQWTTAMPNVLVGAGDTSIDFANARFSDATANALIAAASTGTRISITNGWADNWNRANGGHAAFYADTGATITLSPPPRVSGGNGGATFAGGGTKLQSSVTVQ